MDPNVIATIKMLKSILSGMVEFAQKGSAALDKYCKTQDSISFSDEMKLKSDFTNFNQALHNIHESLAMLVVKGFDPDELVIQDLDTINEFHEKLHGFLLQFSDRTGGVHA
jgi:hypothetical protein